MRKLPYAVLLISLMFFPLNLIHGFNVAQAATVPPSIINSDTTWTTINSPYILSGPVLVSSGVTLTIEAGATVNLATYYLQVNGTLNARGTSTNPIQINGGENNAGGIKFTASSTSWSEQSNQGCIVQNAVINQTVISITGSSVKISDNTFTDGADMMHVNVAVTTIGGASLILNNNFKACGLDISDNSTISDNIIAGGIGLYGGSPLISKNTISGGSSYFFIGRSFDRDYNTVVIDCSATVSANNIHGSIILNGNGNGPVSALITGNTIDGMIGDGEGSINVVISNNKCSSISLNNANSVTINNNLILNADNGLEIGSATIKDNTIANCKTAILVINAASPIMRGNNIVNSSQYNLKLSGGLDVDASNNWWGTTDASAIGSSIYDKKNDFNLGTVTFTPFLTAASSNAPALDYIPVPSSAPTPSPTPAATSTPVPPTSVQSGNSSQQTQQTPISLPNNQPVNLTNLVMAIMAVIIVALVLIIVVLIKRTAKKRPSNYQNPPTSAGASP